MVAETGFEVLGLDFVVDEDLKPWLMEVNNMPVLGVRHSVPSTCELIRSQKGGMINDMVRMLMPRVIHSADMVSEMSGQRVNGDMSPAGGSNCVDGDPGEYMGRGGIGLKHAYAELACLGRFAPLMPWWHFPGNREAASGSLAIPWDASDQSLQGFLKHHPPSWEY
jgi:Tubulin-tyrosine ligase family